MLENNFVISGIFIFLIALVCCQNQTDDRDSGLFPMVFNLATHSDITSNATCGDGHLETFCKLVEHVEQENPRYVQCGVCHADSQYEDEKYPITNAIDGTHASWQSPTIANGREYNWVTVTLDLKQVYQIAYIVITTANSPRPGNWILERSVDGVEYKPWQYYAISDSDCWNIYNVPPTIGIPRYKNDDEVICTSFYSKLNPFENGEVHTSLVNGRPGVEGPSQELLDFTRARYIQLRLQRIRTLNADLMTFAYYDPKELDPTVSNRYFYSIKDISIGGQCICYGHASQCPIDQFTGEMLCDCEGNTCGGSCDTCCPLYNQHPWKPGTYTEAFLCEQCNCFSHADSCVFNQTVADLRLSMNIDGVYQGGGVCTNCTDNTMGINCEMCDDGYYHPPGVSQHDPDACRMCLCLGPGTTGLCVKDNSMEMEGIFAGDCYCREGYCGPRCEECSPGYMNYPLCEPCPCDPGGSVNMDTCEEQCVCKPFVCGERCDQCLPGFYNLDMANPDGCQPCFCFGLSHECTSLTWGRNQLTSLKHWVVTDLAGSGIVTPTQNPSGVLTIKTEDTATLNKAIYWGAPSAYVGNKVLSYGGVLQFTFTYSINCTDEPEAYLANYDLIIEGSGMRFGHSGQYWQEDVRNLIAINMTESGWRHLDGSTSPRDTLVPLEEFLIVLALIDRLLIRASFHMYQTESQLLQLSLDVASRTGSGPPMYTVEQCSCPEGYAGTSCESCSSGFRRVSNMLMGGTCEPCNCGGHTDSCDPYTGECLDCQHLTTGFSCDQCAPGCHGDPSLGPEGCVPCACPLEVPSNNFAEKCVITPDDTEEYLCIGCLDGYDGRYCELCDRGYYGDPMTIGSLCQPCDCHGNMDTSLPEPCNRMTGECFGCRGNVHGKQCDQCNEYYYGTAVNGDCQECACNPYGSLMTCDPVTGQCLCKDRYMGRDCGMCEYGYGNIALGCVKCSCSLIGSESDLCDPVTGQCPCRSGVTGHHCTECQNSYFGFSIHGCEDCQCNIYGSVTTQCQKTGECQCLPNVMGKYCDQCWPDHWGLSSGTGCKLCICDPVGAEVTNCDLESGQCRCKPGVTGQRCDQCLAGYYGFSVSGCRQCPVCAAPGQVCDPITGECVCPQNTEGPQCERCVHGSWGHDLLNGCKPCECHTAGSVSQQCDVGTGACNCHHGYTGTQCDQCPHGYYDFPFCAPCDCDIRGTDQVTCKDGVCGCDASSQCQCKEDAVSTKCDRCGPNSFSLDITNPSGCTECFCFGRTKSCGQAAYHWTETRLPDQFVSVFVSENLTIAPSMQGFMLIPVDISSVTLHPSHLDLPLYFSLPQTVHNDQTLSYNGRLRFTITDALPAPGFPFTKNHLKPEVYIVGNFRVHLQYMGPVRANKPRDNVHTIEVLLREDLWLDGSGKPVSRATFMVALQNVQHWVVKATTSVGITEEQLILASASGIARLGSARLSAVSLQVGAPHGGQPVDAFGIEVCDCPPEYEGLSCQNPVTGYYRRRPEDFMGSTDVLDLVGLSVLCQCHGHSEECDRESGACRNCRHHTTDEHCHICATGYYGYPTRGTHDDCQPCACPLLNINNNPTCVSVGTGEDYICDDCAEGYSGEVCDSCAVGYYGNPTVPGGSCSPCDCSRDGSLDEGCDPVTGQCTCYPGITGLQCDQCLPRHVVMGARCLSCDEGCPGILMRSVDEFKEELDHFDTSSVLPYAKLSAMERDAEEMWKQRASVGNISAPSLRNVQNLMEEIKINSRHTQNRVEDQLERLDIYSMTAEDMWFDADDLSGEVLAIHDMSKGTVNQLIASGFKTNSSLDIDKALGIARNILAEIIGRNLGIKMEKLNSGTEVLLVSILNNEIIELLKKVGLSTLAKLKDRLAADLVTLEEFMPLVDSVDDMIGDAAYWNDDNVRLVEAIEEKQRKLKENRTTFDDSVAEAEEINDRAIVLLTNESLPSYQRSTELLDLMHDKSLQVEIKTDLFEKGLPDVIPVHDEAQVHAQMLQKQAQKLEDEFADTRQDTETALRAATVYGIMAENITQAYDNSGQAIDMAQNATNIMEDHEGGPVRLQTKQALEDSKDLNDNSTALDSQSQDMKERLSDSKTNTAKTRTNLREAEEILDNIKTMQNQSQDADLTSLNYKAITTIAKATTTSDAATDIINDLEDNLEVKVKEMSMVNVDDISMANASVNAARREFNRLMNLTRMLEVQKERVDLTGAEVNRGLLELREKIRQARELAKSIKLSLQHNGNCARRYEADVKTSTSNTILLHFKTERPNQDMLLFMLHSQNTSEYLIIEMISSKIRLSWDVGGGLGVITHFLLIDGSTHTHDKWYRVYAERYGSQSRLTVKLLDGSTGEGQFVPGGSPATHTILEAPSNTPIYVGSAPRDYPVPLVVRSTTFSGCIGGVMLDGKDIGLYNFRELTGNRCGGCRVPPGVETGGDLTYQFDGSGYTSRLNAIKHTREFSLTFRFRSYWEDALLFFTHDPEKNEFISVELVDGYVVFKYTDNNVMTSKFKYNNNRWVRVTVQASWNLEKAALIINNNDEVMESKDLVQTNMENPVLYIGGVPPTVDVSLYGVTSVAFLGCFMDMHLGPKIINLLDGSGVVVGMQIGCKQENLNTVGLKGTGYVELPSYDLNKDGSLFFSFRTYSKNGLMLLAKAVNPLSYYSVSMLNGVVHAWFNAGVGRAEIGTLSRYDDGKLHGLSVIKTNRRMEMYIDDKRVGSAQLPQGASRIIGMRGELGGLFVGGIPEGLDAFGKAASIDPFKGCISNIGINNLPLIMGTPLDYSHADIGRCDMAQLFPEMVAPQSGTATTHHSFTITITLPTLPVTTPTTTPKPTEHPSSCAVEGVYDIVQAAQAFGDLVNSYAEILVRKRDIIKDFNMTVEIRTFYKTGMIFFITNELQNDYVAVQLQGGRIVVAFNDRKSDTKEMLTNILVNDGQWHTIRLMKDFKSITITVDNLSPLSSTITRKIDVIAPIYVGGFDPRFGAEDGVVTESFKGCMRAFNLNAIDVDLANSKRVMGVRPCFKNVERGVHFNGYGYSTYAEFYEIDSYLKIEFDFKTTKRDGVIISISNYRDNPALALEMHDGWLKFSAVNSGGTFIAVGGECEFCLCDNVWHHVVAEYIKNAVTLTVDGGSPKVGVGGNDMRLGLRNELYIGGLPGFGNPGVSQTREFFVGCMRELTLNGTVVEWHKTFELEDVHVAACPVEDV